MLLQHLDTASMSEFLQYLFVEEQDIQSHSVGYRRHGFQWWLVGMLMVLFNFMWMHFQIELLAI